MSETPNVLTPRQLAVAFIAERIRDVRATIDAHQAETDDPANIFRSQIRVFLEQVAVELRRAARHIEDVDSADEDDA
jgi:hypothetical protein